MLPTDTLELDEDSIAMALRYVAEVSRMHISYDQYYELAEHTYKVTELCNDVSRHLETAAPQ